MPRHLAKTRVAAFPFALRPGDFLLAETDEIPPHHDLLAEGFAAEQKYPGAGGQFQAERVGPVA